MVCKRITYVLTINTSLCAMHYAVDAKSYTFNYYYSSRFTWVCRLHIVWGTSRKMGKWYCMEFETPIIMFRNWKIKMRFFLFLFNFVIAVHFIREVRWHVCSNAHLRWMHTLCEFAFWIDFVWTVNGTGAATDLNVYEKKNEREWIMSFKVGKTQKSIVN